MAEQIPAPETVENQKAVHVAVQKYAGVEGTWIERSQGKVFLRYFFIFNFIAHSSCPW